MTVRAKWMPVALLVLLGAGCGMVEDDRDVTTSSQEAFDAYQEGLRQRYRRETAQARIHFEKAVEADPDFAMAHMALARALRSLGETEAARHHVERGVELLPNLPEEEQLQIRIDEAAMEFQIEEASRYANELLEKYPENTTAIAWAAERAWMDLEYDKAITHFNQILAEDAERVDIHNYLGSIYLSAGRFEDAITSFRRYIYFAPGLPDPIDSLGQAYLACGRYEEAIKQFNEALEIDPTFLSAGRHLSQALASIGRLNNARKILDQMNPIFEERNQAKERHVLLMNLAYEMQDWEELLRLSEEAEVPDEIDPEHPNYPLQVFFSRTVAQLELGLTEDAKESADIMLAHLDRIRGRLPESNVIKGQFLIVDAFMRSRFARTVGRPADGIPRLEKALVECGFEAHHLAEFRLELAQAYFEDGQFEKAFQTAKQALEHVQNEPKLNLLAARALVELGREREALTYLGRYVETMRLADATHPDVQVAERLAARLVPSE